MARALQNVQADARIALAIRQRRTILDTRSSWRKKNSSIMKTVLNFPYLRLFWVMALGVDSSVRMIAGTFSDANWISVNSSLPGADSTIFAAVEDSAGNLYVGGHFSVV